MRSLIKKFIKSLFNLFKIEIEFNKPVYWAEKILIEEFGHTESNILQRPVDKDQNPIPWYTYPFIEYLNEFDLSKKLVFEWGSGNSSIFFSQKAKSVISIESDEKWYNAVKQHSKENLTIEFCNDLSYYASIGKYNCKFDVIVIDGKFRTQCAKIAPQHLEEGGMIILDNSDWNPRAVHELREAGLIQIDFSGFGPVNRYTWTTSMFISREFNFKKRNELLTPLPIGGLRKVSE